MSRVTVRSPLRSVARLVRSSLRAFAACLSAQVGTVKMLKIYLKSGDRAIEEMVLLSRSPQNYCNLL
ncbi:hypothetical protein JJD41_23775 [Oxynema sp. CENA135]|uniref:hypothetical protein n=1 Tax=Oxynema sp. CENA135 TaxID=984206 RepID=UPI00190B5DD1|nr:hypothetical protein [Oxynema sp. CENA135]MBK4732864.1 hypothetical protein [Oxynema sp. CENA135]